MLVVLWEGALRSIWPGMRCRWRWAGPSVDERLAVVMGVHRGRAMVNGKRVTMVDPSWAHVTVRELGNGSVRTFADHRGLGTWSAGAVLLIPWSA